MKRSILVFAILFIVTQVEAQKTFKSRAGKYQWCYQLYSFGQLFNTFYDKIDTIPNDTSWVKMFNGYLKDSNNQVFYKELGGSNPIKIIYDFNLIVGDTFTTSILNKGITKFIVTKRDKVKIESDSLVRLELINISYTAQKLKWIESIGSINYTNPFNWTIYYNVIDNYYNLKCVENLDKISITKSIGKDCYQCDFFNTNKTWNTWASQSNGDLKYDVKFNAQNRDTILNSKKYKFMNNYTLARYDTTQGRYYLLSNTNNQDFLIYNEHAKIGDTISNIPYSSPQIVSAIDVQKLNEDFIKIYTTQNDKYQSNLGSIKRVLWDNHIIVTPEYKSGNFCFEEVFFSSTFTHKFTDYYLKNSCSASSGISEHLKDKIGIFYQNSQLYISNLVFSNTSPELKIYNLLGQVVFHTKLNDQSDQQINLELKNGIYFAQLNSKNSNLKTSKFSVSEP
jgi:hypothetical protein